MTVKEVLGKCQIFAALGEDELDIISNLARNIEYEAGVTIFHEGDEAGELLVLDEGKVALQMSLTMAQAERRVTVDIVDTNEVLGWSAIVEPCVYTFTALCLQKTKVLSINGPKLRSLIRENRAIGYQVLHELIKVVASRLDDTRRVLVSERLMPMKTGEVL